VILITLLFAGAKNTDNMFGVLFYLLLVSGHYCLDAVIYGNLQDLEEQDSEQLWEGKACDP
jgi:cytochrome P450